MPESTHSWTTFANTCFNEPGGRCALVSMVAKEGSSYLQPGARMLVREDGHFWGEISAGCLEEKVAQLAVDCIQQGTHRTVTVDTRPLYGCFGTITLLIEVIRDAPGFKSLLATVESARTRRACIDVVTDFGNLEADTLTRIDEGRCSGKSLLRETLTPPIQLLVLGDWPDGRAATEIGRRMGWDATLVDASIPGFDCAGTLDGRIIDAHSAILLATHHLARDAACLEQVLRQPCGYVGVIGSRQRRHELGRILAELDELDVLERFEAVHCPAGLDIGGEGAQAIALSVIAEIQACLSRRDGQQLSTREAPIHLEEVTA